VASRDRRNKWNGTNLCARLEEEVDGTSIIVLLHLHADLLELRSIARDELRGNAGGLAARVARSLTAEERCCRYPHR
jgi:hypothetical protein